MKRERKILSERSDHIGSQVATIISFLHAGTVEEVIRAVMKLNLSRLAPSNRSYYSYMIAIVRHAQN